MKPIKLTMEAFESYQERTVIDFTGFQNDIFLIQGESGAGKTAIFDAIVFALYGEASMPGRRKENLHCNKVGEDVDTLVELVFTHDGKEYKVSRTYYYGMEKGGMKFKPRSGKNNGVKLEGAAQGEGDTEVTGKIKEILGLDKEQFTKIVLLAQGAFAEFLKAESKKKEEILEAIFDNAPFKRFQERIAQAYKILLNRRKEDDEKIRSALTLFQEPDEAWGFSSSAFSPGEPALLENLSLLIEMEEEEAARIREIGRQKEAEQSELDRRFGEAKVLKENQSKLEEDRKEFEKWQAKEETNRRRKEQIETAQKAWTSVRPLEEAWNREKEKQEKNRTEIEAVEQKLEENRQLLQGDSPEEMKLRLKEAEKAEEQASFEEDSLFGENGLYAQAQSIKAEEDEKAQRPKELEIQLQTVAQKKNEYDEIHRLFLHNQAALLSEALRKTIEESGRAYCPVCQTALSRENIRQWPDPSGDLIEKKDVDEAESAFKEAEETYMALKEEIERFESDSKLRWGQVQTRWESLGKGAFSRALLLDESARENNRAAVQNRLLQARNEKKRITTRLQAYEKAQENQISLQANRENLAKKIEDAEKEIYFAQSRWEEKCREQGFAGPEHYHEALAIIPSSNQEKWLQEQKEEIRLFFEEGAALKTRIETREKNLEGKKIEDAEALKEQIAALKKEKDAYQGREKNLSIQLENHKLAAHQVRSAKSNLEKTSRAFERLDHLNKVAGGDTSEQGKYDFNSYVLGAVFDEVLKNASVRLERLSNGRFTLERSVGAGKKSAASKTGFETLVVEEKDGELIRSETSAVSGGESFLVSLALAFGLSDEVMSRAGGKALESLFLDEGFGALSRTYLNNALEELQPGDMGGARRLVGIISHVEQIKDEIMDQIVVTRDDRKGSQIEYRRG